MSTACETRLGRDQAQGLEVVAGLGGQRHGQARVQGRQLQQLQRVQREALVAPDVLGDLAGALEGRYRRKQKQRVIQLAQGSPAVDLMQDDVPVLGLGDQFGLKVRHTRAGILLGANRLDMRSGIHMVRIQGVHAPADQEWAGVLQSLVKEGADDVGHLPQLLAWGVTQHTKPAHGDACVGFIGLGRKSEEELLGLDAHMLAQGGDLVLDGLAVVVGVVLGYPFGKKSFRIEDGPQEIDQAVRIEGKGRQVGGLERGVDGVA